MAQAKRDPLETRSNRLKLKPQVAPYGSKLKEGKFISYFRPRYRAAGTWRAKWRDAQAGARKQTKLGTADDYADVKRDQVLTWTQANEKARTWFDLADHEAVLVAGGEVLPSGPCTVAQALHDYI